MKAVYYEGGGRFALREAEPCPPERGEARLEVAYCGICGQGPSDYPDLAQWLVEQKIESMSLNPDTVVETWIALARASGAKR